MVLAGHDPSTVEYRHVVDVAWALVMEIYREYGLKFDEATDELEKRLYRDEPKAQRPQKAAAAPPDASTMAVFSAALKSSNFKGAGR